MVDKIQYSFWSHALFLTLNSVSKIVDGLIKITNHHVWTRCLSDQSHILIKTQILHLVYHHIILLEYLN